MARIRTIKPEFWTHGALSECLVSARLLFIGMWNFCDDQGHHVLSFKRLKMEIFPGDEMSTLEIQEWITQLYDHELIGVYNSEDKLYIKVLGWSDHQIINRPSTAFFLPVSDTIWTVKERPIHGVLSEYSVSAHGTLRTEWDGMERNVKEKKTRKKKKGDVFGKDAIEVLEFLNLKTGRNYRPVKSNLDLIAARLASGVEVKHCKWVIVKKCDDWLKKPDMQEFLRPKTLFSPKNFEQYYGQLNWDIIRENELLKTQGGSDEDENVPEMPGNNTRNDDSL